MRCALLMLLGIPLAGCATNGDAAENHGAPAPDAKVDVSEMCASVTCVHDVRIVLTRPDGSVFDETFDALPLVQGNRISVYAGQTVSFEADLDGDRLVNLKAVDSAVNPKGTVTASLEQVESGGMMLTVKNSFDRSLRIRMGMMPLSEERLVRTSSCPVISGGSGFEMWPYPIFQVMLADMQLLGTNDSMACVE